SLSQCRRGLFTLNSSLNLFCCCCCCCCLNVSSLTELQFVQIILIMVVMAVMVVLIICLLNHYKFSGCSGVTRQSQGSRQEEMLQQVGLGSPTQGASEVTYAQRERLTAPAFMQRDRFCRFQPTYPPQQHQIDLPPTICLSDGEEPPPYQGPCTLQLRDPDQQMELSRESVRAPPNRTVFDSDLIAGCEDPELFLKLQAQGKDQPITGHIYKTLRRS
uniref:Low density lipoprotein receptor class A domain containing 4 n=1 Tax=Paramormyrops kingsleyae TaxID=1676925 RepID=A0A3B3R1L6_9TELE